MLAQLRVALIVKNRHGSFERDRRQVGCFSYAWTREMITKEMGI
ncbi:MAG: hypothetical protein SGJ24_04475 [Chloroflexota bacterium]|nr:hypothetical protein [Chloroflexota bacterium]